MEKIKWSQKAKIDILHIYDYIFLDSEYYANKTVIKIIESINILNLFPRAGRKIHEYSNEEYRELIYKSYRIIYKVEQNKIIIQRIWHSARLLSKEIIS